MILQPEFKGTGLEKANFIMFVSCTMPDTEDEVEESTVREAPVIVAAVVIVMVPVPLSILPPELSVTSKVIPLTVAVLKGFLKPLTANPT